MIRLTPPLQVPVTFVVLGVPVPQGSMKLARRGRMGRPMVVHSQSGRLRSWRQAVAAMALAAGVTPRPGPVSLDVTFVLPRPKRTAWDAPAVRPDADKMVRSTLDALTGIAYQDDGQVTHLVARKTYATPTLPPQTVVVLR